MAMKSTGTVVERVGDKPSPGRLRIVHAFLNTRNGAGREDIAEPAALRDWLVRFDLLSPHVRVTQADVAQAHSVRDALIRLAIAHHTGDTDAGAVDTLNRAARSAQMSVSFDVQGRGQVRPLAPDVDGALGELIAIVFEAMHDGSWDRLKICRDETCAFAFFDRSKNHSGTWCDIAVCGNVAKARAFRARHHRHG